MSMVPLHSVVFVFGDGLDAFPENEILRPSKIKTELLGIAYHNSIDNVLTDDLANRIFIRLRLGQRVIIEADTLDKSAMNYLIERSNTFGVPVIIVCDNADNVLYRRTKHIDMRKSAINLIYPLPSKGVSEHLSTTYAGITAIGDVHGMYDHLMSAITWARTRNNFLVLVGDVIDYGNESLKVADEVYKLVTNGEAMMITGNHERKIARWIEGYRVRLSDGNRVTTDALSNLSNAARYKWSGRFRGLFQNSRLFQKIGNVMFAHGAVHPSSWQSDSIDSTIESLSMFGEIDGVRSKPDRPVNSFNWVDSVPKEHYAVVGHTIRSRHYPILQTNKRGGNALFLDTGSGKGGRLSSVDFRFITPTELKMEHFNIY